MNNDSNSDEQGSPKPLAVTVDSACKIIGVGRTLMWALIKDGRVKSIRLGRRRLVIYASLETLLTEAVS
jgi:excisionase family DNA binding protein